MKTLALILLPLVCIAAESPSDLDSLLDSARGAPAEFAADATLRIAESQKLSRERRIELIEEAFRRAGGAQEAFQRRSAAGRLDGRSGFLERAYGQGLDSLSLRLRAVEQMLDLDPAKARALFLEIPPPRLQAASCDDPVVFKVDRFYEVLPQIAARTFSAKETAQDEPFHLLLRYGTSVESPVQVAPEARMLAGLQVNDDQFQALATAFAGSLKGVPPDARSFFATRTSGVEIYQLVQALQRRKLSPVPLLEAYRLYLVRQGSGPRCAEAPESAQTFGFATPEQKLRQQAQDAFTFFNEVLRTDPVQPIEESDVQPSKVEGDASKSAFCQDPECRAAADQFLRLTMDGSGIPYAADQRNSQEWQNRLKDYLNQLADWKESTGVSIADQFREKCSFYNDALNLALNGPGRTRVFRAMLAFLEQSRLRVPNRMEWLLPVNALIGRATLDPLGMGSVAEELSNSEDPVISLYMRLERLLPRTPDRIMPLL